MFYLPPWQGTRKPPSQQHQYTHQGLHGIAGPPPCLLVHFPPTLLYTVKRVHVRSHTQTRAYCAAAWSQESSLIRPCMMRASEAWTWIRGVVSQVLTAEREFGRWCLRLTTLQPDREQDGDGSQSLHDWIIWTADTAGEVANHSNKAGFERWHKAAIMSSWNWAGHFARAPPHGMNNLAALHVHRPRG